MKNAVGSLELIGGSMFSGKCLSINTPILMYNGTIKLVQDILQGDILMGDDSTPRNVLNITSGQSDLYVVIPSFGEPYVINDEHILSLKCSFARKKYENTVNPKYKKGKVVNLSVKDYLSESNEFRNCYKGYRMGVEFPYQEITMDPYILGAWLGDGSKSESIIYNIDPEIIEAIEVYAHKLGLKVTHNEKTIAYKITEGVGARKNIFIDMLRNLNIYKNKHVPLIYKANSRDVRLAVLAGLLDTDGYYDKAKHAYEITQKLKVIADDILFLARSLGFVAYSTYRQCYCTYKGVKKYGWYYRVHISGTNMCDIPCLVERKKAVPHTNRNDLLVGIDVKPFGFGRYYGFQIDGNHLFLLGDFTVTHNTTELLRRLSCDTFVKRKVLYINHSLDTRSTESFSTHNPLYKEKMNSENKIETRSCSSLPYLEDLIEFNTIGIDEAQFFDNLSEVHNYVEKGNKRVIVSGLVGDAERKKFGHITDLIPMAENYTQLCASCVMCADEVEHIVSAPFTHRISGTQDNQIDTGGKDKYISVCRKHHIKLNSQNNDII